MSDGFFPLYLRYVKNTETPKMFHLWCATSGIAASLGKNFWFTRGHFRVYPNLYIMLIGAPGTGKGTSMNILQNLLIEAGYRTFAADRSSKEKFLLDLQEGFLFTPEEEGVFSSSLNDLEKFLGKGETSETSEIPNEVFVLAEEFNDFIGTNNLDFISLLTKLWSFSGIYRNRLKNSKSVNIYEPCINILGGNTSAGFNMAFPPEIIGQGFLARLLPIYGESSGVKISFPTPPDKDLQNSIIQLFVRIREEVRGEAEITEEAMVFLDRIHQEWLPLPDLRFQHYGSRRFNQLIKLCLIQAASRLSRQITIEDIRAANTILIHTEELMPKAIGEFGKAKNSEVASKVMEALYLSKKPLSTADIWKIVCNDLNSMAELATVLQSLQNAERIQMTPDRRGWLPKVVVRETGEDLINKDLKRGLS